MPFAALVDPQVVDVDSLPCGWLRLDARGVIVMANTLLAQLAGRGSRHDRLEGCAFDSLLTLPSRVVFQGHLTPLLRFHSDTAEFSLALQPPAGGTPLDVLVYSRRSAGLPDHVDLIVVPIRQRRRIEEELVRVQRAADQAPLMMFQLVSLGGQALRFAYASQSVRQLYGCTPEAAAASAAPLLARLQPASAVALHDALAAAAREQRICRLNLQLAPVAGAAAHTHEFVAAPRPRADGHTLWHGYLADVTERLQLEREAAEREGAEQVARLRKDFLARASHELRTPLNAILGFAQLLGRDEAQALRPDQRQALATLHTAGRHMLALVNQLLDLSRAEHEGAALSLLPVRLAPELAAALEPWHAGAAARGQRLALVLPPALAGVQVLADAVALRQVLGNLLSNAVKYTPDGGGIELRAEATPARRVRLVVADTGPGLGATQREHLFEPFNRLGAEHGATEGTGLGLVVSRHLVQGLGSALELDSQPGQGCRFAFELPLAEEARPAPAAPAAAAEARPAAGGARGLVVYVEDNEVNVLLMQAIVALRPGIRLHVARSGQEAEALFDAGLARPDLLLLDLNLPDTGGHELLQRLREREALAAVPALLVTATTGDEALRPGGPFQGCWFKPLDIEATLADFDRLLA